MKKLFLFAVAAVTMAAGCQKIQELVNPGNQPVDDNSPVAIEFTTNVATVETRVRTKAEGSVTVLGDAHTLYIYGINSAEDAPKSIYNQAAKTNVREDNGVAALEWEDGVTRFYNGTTDRYDFYGYYVDDATVTTAFSNTNFQSEITITGQQDILLAKADKNADVAGKTYTDGTAVSADDAYSAKTARAGVKPNLKFEHQLSQFTFAVRNMGTSNIYLKGIALSTIDKGTLTVVDDATNTLTQGLTASTTATAVELTLPMDQEELAKQTSGYTNIGTYFGTSFTRTSVMAFPGQAYNAVLYLTQDGMEAGKARKVTVPVTITNGAQKGYSYELKITVYSLEEVQITASLAPWEDGDPVEIDSENSTIPEDEVDYAENLTAKMVANTSNSITYEINIPAGFTGTSIQAAYSENTTAPEANSNLWTDVTTKSLAEVTFNGLDATKTYYCHLRYKETSEATDYTTLTVDETTAAMPFSMEIKGVAKDEESYTELLPKWYQTQYGNYDEYMAGQGNENWVALPWFVIECAPAPKVEITIKKGDGEAQEVTFNGAASKNGLITIAASEVDGTFEITEGTYTISINGASETVTLNSDLEVTTAE